MTWTYYQEFFMDLFVYFKSTWDIGRCNACSAKFRVCIFPRHFKCSHIKFGLGVGVSLFHKNLGWCIKITLSWSLTTWGRRNLYKDIMGKLNKNTSYWPLVCWYIMRLLTQQLHKQFRFAKIKLIYIEIKIKMLLKHYIEQVPKYPCFGHIAQKHHCMTLTQHVAPTYQMVFRSHQIMTLAVPH